ncbi:MAG TPA: glycosyltransferase family 4 protein [Pyrinomonadaceae bacterium]|jgi:glycosyltransferase involved in cell wall biosynthesis
MSSSDTRPRVGLIVSKLAGLGGMELSSFRHVRLLSEKIAVIPISLEKSDRESDWYGRVEQADCDGHPAYRILASDFRVDQVVGVMDVSQLSYVDQLVNIARRERLSALHVYGAFERRPFVAAIAAIRLSLPLIITFRGSDLDLRIFGNHLAHLQAALRVASACVCVNSSAQQVLRRLFNPTCPSFVIHNHVDPAEFDASAKAVLSCPRPIIGCVGEFRRLMGLDFLLQAFKRLAGRREASLLLAGPFRRVEAMYYNHLTDTFKYSQRVYRTGAIKHSQILAYMQACDVLVFPSISDGCPNKVLEAMLAGRAIVASDVGGIPELVRDGVDAVLVEPRDDEQLLNALESLLDDPARARSLGESARRRALSDFTPAVERAAWLQCYEEAGL